MATIGELKINIFASTAQASRELDLLKGRAADAVKDIQKGFGTRLSGQGFQVLDREARTTFRNMREEKAKARNAADLLGNVLGVRLPRELRSVLAGSQAMGRAMSAAFNISVAAAFADVIANQVVGAIEAVQKKWFAFEDAVATEREKKAVLAGRMIVEEQSKQAAIALAIKRSEVLRGLELQLRGLSGFSGKRLELERRTEAEVSLLRIEFESNRAEAQRRLSLAMSLQERNEGAVARKSLVQLEEKFQVDVALIRARGRSKEIELDREAALARAKIFSAIARPRVPLDLGQFLEGRRELEATEKAALDLAIALPIGPTQQATELFRIFGEQSAKAMEKLKPPLSDVAAGLQQVGLRTADAFRQAIIYGRGFRGVLESLLFELANFALSGVFQQIAKALTGKSGGKGFLGALGGFLGGLFGGGRQFGGPVQAGKVYETHGLGDREIFVPAMSGRIVAAGAGGGGVTVNNYVDARFSGLGVEADWRRALRMTHDQAVATAIATTRERSRRRP